MSDTMMLAPTIDRESSVDDFLSEAVYGLSQAQKTLPCKFLYDEEGSRLFNEICELVEYYPTRTENRILSENIKEIVRLMGRGCRLVEFGSGTSTKTRHLLNHLPELSSYVPIDISGAQLLESSTRLAREFPDLEIRPLEADYGEISKLPDSDQEARRTVAFFPGSTIGNFTPGEAVAFLGKVASLCGAGRGPANWSGPQKGQAGAGACLQRSQRHHGQVQSEHFGKSQPGVGHRFRPLVLPSPRPIQRRPEPDRDALSQHSFSDRASGFTRIPLPAGRAHHHGILLQIYASRFCLLGHKSRF